MTQTIVKYGYSVYAKLRNIKSKEEADKYINENVFTKNGIDYIVIDDVKYLKEATK